MVTILNVDVSLVAIALAVIANIVIGMIWFNPSVMGSQWMALVGKKMEDAKATAGDYLLTIVGAAITAFVLNVLIVWGQMISSFSGLAGAFGQDTGILGGEWSTWVTTFIVVILAWAGFTMPSAMNRMVWEGSRKKLFFLNMAHQLVSFLAMGIIIMLVLENA